MHYPRVITVTALDDHTLLIGFDNQQARRYDIRPLLAKAAFAPLNNPELFRRVRVEPGGYAVAWNEEIDISEYELWQHGMPVG